MIIGPFENSDRLKRKDLKGSRVLRDTPSKYKSLHLQNPIVPRYSLESLGKYKIQPPAGLQAEESNRSVVKENEQEDEEEQRQRKEDEELLS